MEGVWWTTPIYTSNSGWVIPSILIAPKVSEIQTWCRSISLISLKLTFVGNSHNGKVGLLRLPWKASACFLGGRIIFMQRHYDSNQLGGWFSMSLSISSSKHLPKVPKYSIISPGSAPDLKWLYASCMKVTPKINMTIPSSSIAQNKVFTDLRCGCYQLPRFPLVDTSMPKPKSNQPNEPRKKPYIPLNPGWCFFFLESLLSFMYFHGLWNSPYFHNCVVYILPNKSIQIPHFQPNRGPFFSHC